MVVSTLSLRFASNFVMMTGFVIFSMRLQMVHSNPMLSIDCDCNAVSLELDLNACCVNDPPEFDATTTFNFVNVPNTSVIQFKLHTTQNLTDIPSQFLDTFVHLEYIDVSIGIDQLPLKRLPTKLKQLNLSNNRINAINTDAFKINGGNGNDVTNMAELEQINLQYNQINVISNGAFNGLIKLQVLILYHNKLTILKRGIFAGAPNIHSLDLACNEIVTIEDGAFDLPILKEILISDNKLKSLSDAVFNGAPHLQNIDLQKNQLEHIGRAFVNVRHLHQLQLSDNRRLEDLNVIDFAQFSELISLSVDATNIHSINPSIGGSDSTSTASDSTTMPSTVLSPLNTLSLSQNQLSSSDFLRQLSVFSKLEKLFVDANKFTRFDDADVRNIKKYFPHIELIVTKNNVWDRKWVENILIPVFQTNNIFCSNIKYLNIYIEGFTNSIDGQIIEGTECV